MAAKLIVLAAMVAVCCAKPFYFSALPGVTILRAGRSPSLAYGFGGGIASDIGGIKHSSSFGTSFETGNAQAFGGGIATNNGDPYAGGVGLAQTYPNTYRTYPAYSTPYATPYYSYPYNLGYNNFATPQFRNNYGSAFSSAQSNGGTAIAQSHNGPYGSVASAANINPSESRHGFRNVYGGSGVSSASATSFADGSGTATSLTQNGDDQGGYNTAVSAVQNEGGVRSSTAQTVQQNGGGIQHSGATSINGPNFQAAHSHVVNSGAGAGTYY